MSGKIKAKDLSYDSALPPFLQRLHAQNAGRGDTDRHERAIARPKRAKDPNDDDGPTVVDESGETLTKNEVAHLTNDSAAKDEDSTMGGKLADDGEPAALRADVKHEAQRADQKVTDGTAQKKRKVGKVVGEEDDEVENDAKRLNLVSKPSSKAAKKPKKKAKPIKLAFDENEGS